MGSPLRAGVVSGTAFGLVQAIWPVVTGDGAVAAVFGLLSGIPFGAFMGRFAAKMNERVPGLAPDQRAQVNPGGPAR